MQFIKTQLKRTKAFVPRWHSIVYTEKVSSARTTVSKPTKEMSVMGWLENERGEVLMVKQFKNHAPWALPGGKVKLGESLSDALRREVQEETGLQVTKVTPLDMFDRYPKNNVSVLFRIKVRPRKTFRPSNPKEISEVAFKKQVPVNATPTLRHFFPRIKSGKGWC